MVDELRIDGVPVTKLGVWMPVSGEALADAVDMSEVFSRSPEEWQRAQEEQQLCAAAEFAAAIARHESALSGLGGRLAEVLELHRPQGTGIWVVCGGCEFSGYDAEPPEWPCSTWAVAAGVGL